MEVRKLIKEMYLSIVKLQNKWIGFNGRRNMEQIKNILGMKKIKGIFVQLRPILEKCNSEGRSKFSILKPIKIYNTTQM